MCFSQTVVNVEGLLRCRFRFRKKFGWKQFAAECQREICARESNVGKRVRRVNGNRLLEQGEACLNFRAGYFEKMITALEIKLIGLRICQTSLSLFQQAIAVDPSYGNRLLEQGEA